ncbi:unnamed protein product [Polarella glacialis]|uniref:Uncharacterized protein n=1 Tax=Polarella glacialis TaxID=89957 RepID=A0A813EYF3_POLGL|nr:unnamed protein product [Polarella glacialis]CAE8713068.1 unnamed protein product [Polarella glacialis]
MLDIRGASSFSNVKDICSTQVAAAALAASGEANQAVGAVGRLSVETALTKPHAFEFNFACQYVTPLNDVSVKMQAMSQKAMDKLAEESITALQKKLKDVDTLDAKGLVEMHSKSASDLEKEKAKVKLPSHIALTKLISDEAKTSRSARAKAMAEALAAAQLAAEQEDPTKSKSTSSTTLASQVVGVQAAMLAFLRDGSIAPAV